ncbi:hypothetical protein PV11_09956 [Exophiala sideris]|uniref:Uncharacterized protein n=1 Tax=Exophiala sideris TaxID=1016849 RepID=A0A0D1YTJ3_9EURO|nr:hypothetical protein PV11_09956 [Exophiala sideris]
MNTTLNYIALPGYLLSPLPQSESKQTIDDNKRNPEASIDLILRQWAHTYATGHKVGPASANFSTLAFLYAAWTLPADSLDLKRCYCFAAVCAFVVVPFTVLCILPTSDELYRRADFVKETDVKASQGTGKGESKSQIQDVDTLTLIRKCHFLSKIRALMPLPAILAGLYTIARTGEILAA